MKCCRPTGGHPHGHQVVGDSYAPGFNSGAMETSCPEGHVISGMHRYGEWWEYYWSWYYLSGGDLDRVNAFMCTKYETPPPTGVAFYVPDVDYTDASLWTAPNSIGGTTSSPSVAALGSFGSLTFASDPIGYLLTNHFNDMTTVTGTHTLDCPGGLNSVNCELVEIVTGNDTPKRIPVIAHLKGSPDVDEYDMCSNTV